MMLPPDDYMGMYDARAGMHPGLSASLASLHPFFPHSLLPEAPLSEDDISLFMLLVTYSDALDALPLEATRSFSDLRELDAVLGGTYTCLSDATLAHLGSLTHRLYHLATILENPDATPGERLLALKDVADEARSYKMGGEDKIRVASNTTDMSTSHTDYIDSLLRSLTSLPSLGPYIREQRPQYKRLSDLSTYPLHVEQSLSMPMPSPGMAGGSMEMDGSSNGRRSSKVRVGDYPDAPMSATRTREREPQDASRYNKKRKVPPGATSSQRSRTDSSRNTSSGSNKRRETSGRHGYRDDSDHGASSDDQADMHDNGRGTQRTTKSDSMGATWSGRRVNEDIHGSDDHDGPRGGGRARVAKASHTSRGRDDQDDQRYCFCNNVSYGDMIGCDDDDCEREWFHLGCVGLLKPPQGTWYCDACLERRTQQAKNKAKRGVRPGRGTPIPMPEPSGSARRVSAARR